MTGGDTRRVTLDEFIAHWSNREGGAERANYAVFLTQMCDVLGLPQPGPGVGARVNAETLGDYQFDGFVRHRVAGEPVGTGFIDLYKKNSFILEAKQPRITPVAQQVASTTPAPAIDLFGTAIKGQRAPVAAPQTKAQRKYDTLMRDARAQAEGYARAVPHGWPPFLIVCDVGRSFELYFDWSGNGKGYSFFPDARSYRIPLDQLRDADTRELFRKIWTDPAAADPRARAVEVSTGVAQQLANVATWLEGQARTSVTGADTSRLGLTVEESAAFLMRLLFCMFAESIGLLPKPKFRQFLVEARDNPTWWRKGLEDLWRSMGDPKITDRFSSTVRETVRYFNGNLFHGAQVYELDPLIIDTLIAAAKTEWNHVEPAIFGTLLEHALTPGERGKLGAHFTPKPFVERLVDATIMDVLRPQWDAALAQARSAADAGDLVTARAIAAAFHARLTSLAVLDPACGTGTSCMSRWSG